MTLGRLLTTRHCHEVLANLLSTSGSESPEFLKDFEMPLQNGRRHHDYKFCVYLFRGVMKVPLNSITKLSNQKEDWSQYSTHLLCDRVQFNFKITNSEGNQYRCSYQIVQDCCTIVFSLAFRELIALHGLNLPVDGGFAG